MKTRLASEVWRWGGGSGGVVGGPGKCPAPLVHPRHKAIRSLVDAIYGMSALVNSFDDYNAQGLLSLFAMSVLAAALFNLACRVPWQRGTSGRKSKI